MSESLVINVSADQISRLDMSPLQALRQRPATALLGLEGQR